MCALFGPGPFGRRPDVSVVREIPANARKLPMVKICYTQVMHSYAAGNFILHIKTAFVKSICAHPESAPE